MSRRVRAQLVAMSAAAVLTIALSPPAHADHNGHGHGTVVPSKQDVLDAQQKVSDTQRSVASIQADLATASAQLDALNTAAERAAETYNGALFQWHDSQAAAITARHRAEEAAGKAEVARSQLAGFVIGQETAGTELTTFSTALTAGGPHDLMVNIATSDASSQAYDAQYQAWSAANQLAKVYKGQAEDALAAAADAKAAAKKARAAAKTAVLLQQNAVVAIGNQRASLIKELAQAQHISVSLAAQRQSGLEQRRQARLAQERRMQEEARVRHQQRVEHRRQMRERRQHQTPTPTPTPAPAPPPIDPTPPPPNATAAQRAVNFAYNQLGDTYVWGAAGPDSWDCSGLTMGAWAAGGVALPHWSVAQYAATTPIGVDQLKPGDLVFWADDANDPSTIFHVGLYIGNGNMIHAPRTGVPVKIESIWDWETPDFFGRPHRS
ncbi:MAG: NlpC/P60 family protein [Nocardioidaceae bacterium]